MRLTGTGVLIRAATDDEARAVRRARFGGEFELSPSRSYVFTYPEPPVELGGVPVVGCAFVEFDDAPRWLSAEHHGHRMPVDRDATVELLAFAREVAEEGLLELLADMAFAGDGVSRWTLLSAPHRIELSAELEAGLAPLRRR